LIVQNKAFKSKRLKHEKYINSPFFYELLPYCFDFYTRAKNTKSSSRRYKQRACGVKTNLPGDNKKAWNSFIFISIGDPRLETWWSTLKISITYIRRICFSSIDGAALAAWWSTHK